MIRNGGAVKRFHMIPTNNEQTVAAHSWGVACIVLDLWPDASVHLLRAALHHDVPECVTGDIPATAKWRFPELSVALSRAETEIELEIGLDMRLGDKDAYRLKVADMLELLWYCVEEERLGNKNFKEVFIRGAHYLQEIELDEPAEKMMGELIKMEAEL